MYANCPHSTLPEHTPIQNTQVPNTPSPARPLHLIYRVLSYSKRFTMWFKCVSLCKGHPIWHSLTLQRMVKMFLVRCLFFPNSLWLKFLTFSLGKYTHQVYCFTLKALKYLRKLMTRFWRRLYKQSQIATLTHKVPSDILFSLLMTVLDKMRSII